MAVRLGRAVRAVWSGSSPVPMWRIEMETPLSRAFPLPPPSRAHGQSRQLVCATTQPHSASRARTRVSSSVVPSVAHEAGTMGQPMRGLRSGIVLCARRRKDKTPAQPKADDETDPDLREKVAKQSIEVGQTLKQTTAFHWPRMACEIPTNAQTHTLSHPPNHPLVHPCSQTGACRWVSGSSQLGETFGAIRCPQRRRGRANGHGGSDEITRWCQRYMG